MSEGHNPLTSRVNGASPALILALFAALGAGGAAYNRHEVGVSQEQAKALGDAQVRYDEAQQRCYERVDGIRQHYEDILRESPR